MTTSKKKTSKAKRKTTAKKKTIVSPQEFDAKIDTVLEKIDEVNTLVPQQQPPSKDNKLSKMVELLLKPEGVSLKEMAETLHWLENSIRGAMSVYAKKHKEYTLTSEKRNKVRYYSLKPVTD